MFSFANFKPFRIYLSDKTQLPKLAVGCLMPASSGTDGIPTDNVTIWLIASSNRDGFYAFPPDSTVFVPDFGSMITAPEAGHNTRMMVSQSDMPYYFYLRIGQRYAKARVDCIYMDKNKETIAVHVTGLINLTGSPNLESAEQS